MKVIAAMSAFVGTASAFSMPTLGASVAQSAQSKATMAFSFGKKPAAAPVEEELFCFGLPGNIAPVGDFDPLNLLDGVPKEEVYRWREAELMHSRVAMLAAAGFLVQENFHPLFSEVGQGNAFDGIAAIDMFPLMYTQPALDVWWLSITLGIFIAEGLRINQCWKDPRGAWSTNLQRLKDDHYPGDLGFDPLGLKPEDPEALREMQTKELQNGRLAMIGALGFLAQETITHKPWLSVYQ